MKPGPTVEHYRSRFVKNSVMHLQDLCNKLDVLLQFLLILKPSEQTQKSPNMYVST